MIAEDELLRKGAVMALADIATEVDKQLAIYNRQIRLTGYPFRPMHSPTIPLDLIKERCMHLRTRYEAGNFEPLPIADCLLGEDGHYRGPAIND